MDFTKQNDSVAKLLSISVPEDMDTVYVKNSSMSPLMKKEASILYSAIFGGAKFEDDDFSLTLKAKNGEVQRIYGPSAGCVLDENEKPVAIGIKWGENYATIPLKGSSLVKPKLEKGEDNATFARFEIGEANFGFKDNEIAVCVDYETDTEYYTIAFPLRFQDNQNKPDLASFKTGLKKDSETFLSLLYAVFEGRGGGGGGESIKKLVDLEEGQSASIVEVIDYDFTDKKGNERHSKLLVDDEGNKYWSADILEHSISYLLQLYPKLDVSVLETATSKSGKSKYVSLGQISIDDGEHIIPFGSSIPTMPEKELPEGKYTVIGLDSFMCKKKDGTQFQSFSYVVVDEDQEIYKTFVPAKHRDTLGASVDISPEKPGYFTVFVSGADNGDFTVSQLKCDHKASDFDFDTSNLF